MPTKGMTKAKGKGSSMILPTATVNVFENTIVVGKVATRGDPFPECLCHVSPSRACNTGIFYVIFIHHIAVFFGDSLNCKVREIVTDVAKCHNISNWEFKARTSIHNTFNKIAADKTVVSSGRIALFLCEQGRRPNSWAVRGPRSSYNSWVSKV